ncbi:MAG: IPT/TIG domain-containing protein [Jatrophihabitantaceae bacterium]
MRRTNVIAVVIATTCALLPAVTAHAAVVPSVDFVRPTGASVAGGTRVMIYGLNLDHASAVWFGRIPVYRVRVITPSQIAVTSPKVRYPGTVQVRVRTPDGLSAPQRGAQFTFVRPPTVSSLSRKAGLVDGGDWITITGAHFDHVVGVEFGAMLVRTDLAPISPTAIRVRTPAHRGGRFPITLYTRYAMSPPSAAALFTFARVPHVYDVVSSDGPTDGGQHAQITGYSLSHTTSVWFGRVRAGHFTVANDGLIDVVTPRHAPGTVPVTVVTWVASSLPNPGARFRFGPANAARWVGSDTSFDHWRRQPTTLSCSSSTFCALGDAYGGLATMNGTTWTRGPETTTGYVTYMYCYSSTECFAWAGGNVYEFDGQHWTAAPAGTPVSISTMSCASATSCRAFSGRREYVLDGQGWTASATATAPDAMALTCASGTSCAAIADDSQPWVFGNGAWAKDGPPLVTGAPVEEASCSADGYCMAVVGMHVLVYDGHWRDEGDAGFRIGLVACGAQGFCVATDADGNAHTWNGTWTGPVDLHLNTHYPYLLACAAARSCFAADFFGTVRTFDGSTAGAPTIAEAPSGGPAALSCATATDCSAIDAFGNTFRSSGNGWTGPPRPTVSGYDGRISCPISDFCAAVAGQQAAVRTGDAWSAPQQIDSGARHYLGDVSCATSTFCVAVAGDHTITYDSSGWESPITASSFGLNAISCPSVSNCVAIGVDSVVELVDGTWRAPFRLAAADDSLTTVECTSVENCLIGTNSGDVLRIDTGQTTRERVLHGRITAISCSSAASCVASDGLTTAHFDGAVWSASSAFPTYGITDVDCATDISCSAVTVKGLSLTGTLG